MKKNLGFTMIEVLVAMAVFAISAMAVLNATGQNVLSLGMLEEKTFASIVANNQMSLFKIDGSSISSEKNGSSEMAGREWYWTIKPIDTSDGMLRAIDVIVWQDDKKRDQLLMVRTYVSGK